MYLDIKNNGVHRILFVLFFKTFKAMSNTLGTDISETERHFS